MKSKLAAILGAVCAVAFAFCIPAAAADLSARPNAVPLPIYSWNGFYVGANFGGAFTNESASAGSAFLGAPSTFAANPSGVLGGIQLGYNLQFFPQWLIGIEGELDWTAAQGIINAANAVTTATLTSNHNWYDTLEGRFGYLMDAFMLYAKGGSAWMNADYALSAAGAITGLSSVNATRAGWTVGGGLEAFIAPNWSAKLEYDYLDFGNNSYGFPIAGTGINFKTQVNEVKVGINYHWLPGMLFGRF